MIKQDVESLLGIGDVLPILGGSLALDALELCIKNLIDGSGCIGDVRSVTRSFSELANHAYI